MRREHAHPGLHSRFGCRIDIAENTGRSREHPLVVVTTRVATLLVTLKLPVLIYIERYINDLRSHLVEATDAANVQEQYKHYIHCNCAIWAPLPLFNQNSNLYREIYGR